MTEKLPRNSNSEQISEEGIVRGTLTEQIENLIGNHRESIQEKESRHRLPQCKVEKMQRTLQKQLKLYTTK